jgi:hypothetical protein
MEYNIEKYHLKSSSLFDFLTASEALLLKDKMTRIEYKKGEYMFKKIVSRKEYILFGKGK